MADFLEIGKIVKTHGLKGAMKFISYLESERVLRGIKEVYIKGEARGEDLFKVKSIKKKGVHFLLALHGIENPEAAGKLVGRYLLIPAEKLEKLPEGEYYWRDIIGLEVTTEDGRILGIITSVFPTGSNDVYVCKGAGAEILLPAISDVIREIDLKKRRMLVRLMKGL
ncbi:MAG: ribosome maturation factor RimM [Syntrophales bacterium]